VGAPRSTDSCGFPLLATAGDFPKCPGHFSLKPFRAAAIKVACTASLQGPGGSSAANLCAAEPRARVRALVRPQPICAGWRRAVGGWCPPG